MAKRARKDLVMTLAKALIAAAWCDGEFSLEERNALMELLFNLREVPARDWATLEIYMAAPIEAHERQQILTALRGTIRSRADKRLAKEALELMVEAIGLCDGSKNEVVSEILQTIEKTNVDPLSHLMKLIQSPFLERTLTHQITSSREGELETFIRNRIEFHFHREIKNQSVPDITDDDIQIWSAAGGLLARVANADREVTEEERESMALALGRHWDLPDHIIATLIDIALDEIAKGLDFYRLSRQFYQKTNREERQQFISSLFEIALADGKISHEETEEIRHIARGLKLTHRQMIQAKLTVTEASP